MCGSAIWIRQLGFPNRVLRACFGAAMLALCAVHAHGQSTTWTAASGNWGEGSSWTNSTPNLFVNARLGNNPGGPWSVSATYPAYLPETRDLTVEDGASLFVSNSNGFATKMHTSGYAQIGHLFGIGTTVEISNPGAEWAIDQYLEVLGLLNIVDGGTVISRSFADVGGFGMDARVIVADSGSTWTNVNGPVFIGFGQRPAAVSVLAGGVVSSADVSIGIDQPWPEASGSVLIDGAGSRWAANGSFVVGFGGTGTLTLQNNGLLVSNTLDVQTAGKVILNAGVLSTSAITSESSGAIAFNSGTINLTGNHSLMPTAGLGKALGGDLKLIPGRTLTTSGTLTLSMPVKLDGGILVVGSVQNAQNLDLQRGTLTINSQAVEIAAGQPFGDYLEIRPAMTVNFNGGLSNRGVITGSGRVGGAFVNQSNGEARAVEGATLTFTGASASNHGNIRLMGGFAEFATPLINSSSGRITGRGALKTTGTGLSNNGSVAFSSGVSDVFGDVANGTLSASRGITVSGNADVTFWDDVSNIGASLFRVSAGSSATFFGIFSGSGISGPGSVYFEADVTPGASPALAKFGGDVSFGSTARLLMEIGGTAPGTQHDQLQAAGTLSLGGTLDIEFINGFAPSVGQSFNLLHATIMVGTFEDVQLPILPSGLTWDLSGLYSGGAVTVVSSTFTADFDSDGDVDGADFLKWQRGQSPRPSSAADLAQWKSQFGATTAANLPRGASVPEPATASLLALHVGYTTFVAGRRRRENGT